MTETNRLEYKQELTPEVDIEKEVVAFLNYKEGGFIYIGIDRGGKTVGVDDIDGCMLKLKDRIKNNVSPSAMGLFDIATEQRDGLSVIKLTVASGIEKPYFKTKYGMTPKGAYIRVGTSAEPMPQEQIDRLFATRTRNSIGRIVSNRQDLTFEQLRIYYDEHGKRLNDNFIRITFPIGVHDTDYDTAHVTAHVKEEGTKSEPRRNQEGTVSDTGTNTNNGTNSDTDTAHDTAHVTAHVEKLVSIIDGEMNRETLQELISVNHREYFRKEYLKPSIEAGYIELTIPDKPKSINQKYRLTPKGLQFKEMIKRKKE